MKLTLLIAAFDEVKKSAQSSDETTSEKLTESPNNFKRHTGRCPDGFISDARGRCVRKRKLLGRLRVHVKNRGKGRGR